MLRTLARNFVGSRSRLDKVKGGNAGGLDSMLQQMEAHGRVIPQDPLEYLPREAFRAQHAYYPSNFAHTPAHFFKTAPTPESVRLPDLNTLSLSPNAMSVFLTSMGKIQSRRKTGLSWKEQRKLGKAVRRARQNGLLNTFAVDTKM
ncbi:hypothetical protein J056_003592 [Wallemia ichthyophaga EXF-994]|uniref:Small ribosomal subunit protein bS18m n=1 Tax=Wallemia ichthyophaga (strain EXF-994 / CBS 113033) TaxID=1299270 RepID=R9AP91_WALI9|nr:uncharacterized protein J056_003592 [Wallemia ichthyophaga EXF-994]EOR01916.1 hypothetical protein J056_003592 [Wallemia ichthyophaga EXF-994]